MLKHAYVTPECADFLNYHACLCRILMFFVYLHMHNLANMLKEERQNVILHEVNLHNKVLTTYLVEKLGVSEDTIRRDLNDLADSGRIIKVHGGALSKSFHNSFS